MTTLSPETLLAERDFVSSLARSLLRDSDRADDVAQRAWMVAMRRQPRESRSLRAWLGSVVRNLISDDARAARRRVEHERGAARAEAVPSTADVLEREDDRQRIVQAVLALPEPYRGVVLMRYWEDQSPAAIAARLGVPGATVRAQLTRGREMLRKRLSRAKVLAFFAHRPPCRSGWRPAAAPTTGPAS